MPASYPIVIWATDAHLPERLAQHLPELTRHPPGACVGANALPAGTVVMVQHPLTRTAAANNLPATIAAGLQRSLPAHTAITAASAVWQLTGPPFWLRSPSGQQARLSLSESRLLRCLINAGPDQVVSRTRLQAALRPGTSQAWQPAKNGYQALNMHLSRLRQKARSTGAQLHLDAVAGEGYRLGSTVISHIATEN